LFLKGFENKILFFILMRMGNKWSRVSLDEKQINVHCFLRTIDVYVLLFGIGGGWRNGRLNKITPR